MADNREGREDSFHGLYGGGRSTAYYICPIGGHGRKEAIQWRTRFTAVRLVQG